MLDIFKDDGDCPKICFTYSILPRYVDPQNVSTKKKPFSTFNALKFAHTVCFPSSHPTLSLFSRWVTLILKQLNLLLPVEIYELVRQHFENTPTQGTTLTTTTGQYARVYMKLGEILEGEFFTEYVKKGNIMMRSEGRSMVDNVFELYEGVLRLEVDRRTYEQCGLQGTPIEDGGKKHQKQRWGASFLALGLYETRER
jgi:ribonucleases P/MRP protein subunit RPP40